MFHVIQSYNVQNDSDLFNYINLSVELHWMHSCFVVFF